MPSNTSKTRMKRKNKEREHKANGKADAKRVARNRSILNKG